MKETMSIDEIEAELARLLKKSGDPYLGGYWGENGILSFAPRIEVLERKLGRGTEATIGAASTYYSAFGLAAAKAYSNRNPLKPLFWMWVWRAVITYSKALSRAEKFNRHVRNGFVPSASNWETVGSIYSIIPVGVAQRLAIDCYQKGLEILMIADGNEQNAGQLLIKMGRSHAVLGNIIAATEFVERALATITPTTDPKSSNRIFRDAGIVFISRKGAENFWRGIEYLRQGREIAHDAGLTDSVDKIDGVIGKYLRKKLPRKKM